MTLTHWQRFLQWALMRVRPNTLAAKLKLLLRVKRQTVETAHGRFWIDPVSLLGIALSQRGEHEPAMIATLQQYLHDGATFVDLGANEGYFTVIGATLCGAAGKVVSIEPQSRLLEVIEANVSQNGVAGVTVVNAAVTDKAGTAKIYLTASTNTGGTSLINRSKYSLPSAEIVTKTLEQILDDAAVPAVDLMKVDIEGFEYEALLGSRQVFEQRRVKALALELHPEILKLRGKDASEITTMLEEAGYRLADGTENAVWIAGN